VHLVGYLFIHSQICLCSSLAELHVVSRCACGCCCHHGSVLERQHVEAYECSSIPEITRWRWSFELHSGRGYLWDRRHVLGFVFVPPAGPPGRQVCARSTTSWSSDWEAYVAAACGWAQKPVWGLPQRQGNGPGLSVLREEAGQLRRSQGRTRHGRIMQSAGLERGLVTQLEDA
ncbi:hypothetical protein AB205_0106080, partial [Aquarana catesbeiana]